MVDTNVVDFTVYSACCLGKVTEHSFNQKPAVPYFYVNVADIEHLELELTFVACECGCRVAKGDAVLTISQQCLHAVTVEGLSSTCTFLALTVSFKKTKTSLGRCNSFLIFLSASFPVFRIVL